MPVHYLGPPGSFSHEAAGQLFSQQQLTPAQSIEDVLDAVKKDSATLGIVPIENSLEGPVIRNFDLILEKMVNVCAEITIQIQQNLLSNERQLKDIHIVYSHPHAFAQVRRWLKKELPHAKLKETPSTSAAAQLAAKETNCAAIASADAAKYYKLATLAKNINDFKQNRTRFWVITRKQRIILPLKNTPNQQLLFYLPNTKTSCYIIIKNKVGALCALLNIFALNHISFTAIQSRPLVDAPWRYGFFIDLLVDANDPLAKHMFSELKKKHPFLHILGTYPQYGAYTRPSLVTYNVSRIKNIFIGNSANPRIHAPIKDGLSKFLKNQRLPHNLHKILETRFSIMPSVALYKYRHRKKIEDATREKLLLQKMKRYDILYHLYSKALHISKERIQKKVVLLLKNHQVKETDIVQFKLSELRYYIDHLDSLAITLAHSSYEIKKTPPKRTVRKRE